jgi:crossover junction endonuclease EME1
MDLEASFCMEAGQVKTGEDRNDTYIKMLQEIVRVTPPVAYGIAAEYPDVPSLMNAFRERGATALQDLKVSSLCVEHFQLRCVHNGYPS